MTTKKFKLMENAVAGWGWRKKMLPNVGSCSEAGKQFVITVLNVTCNQQVEDWSKHRHSDTVFITGDGHCLADDCRRFQSWNIDHDLFAVNRSLIFHQRQVTHWAAIDLEETVWFTQNITEAQMPNRRITRHTIGDLPDSVDFTWEMDYEWQDDNQRLVFIGNTGYFSVLISLIMGYKRVILGGMPLDSLPHWYEKTETPGPNWAGHVYRQWIDFKQQVPGAENVRSMSGYSSFILGEATRDWIS
jgi:hypothetical protein